MDVRIEESYKNLLEPFFNTPQFANLASFVKSEYQTKTIYPPAKYIFRAFNECPLHNLKVVILGQDPYHQPEQANGLCFSVNQGIKPPPSLENIFKEIKSDFGERPKTTDLLFWAQQGVLLLNATLTVVANNAGSHQNKGWEVFTDFVIEQISTNKQNLVFMLWGAFAQQKIKLIDTNKHYILISAHPSPLSAHRGFLGCGHFSKANQYLMGKGLEPIDWVNPK